jgi:hypothetical protein
MGGRETRPPILFSFFVGAGLAPPGFRTGAIRPAPSLWARGSPRCFFVEAGLPRHLLQRLDCYICGFGST